jgi:hypothetical protein
MPADRQFESTNPRSSRRTGGYALWLLAVQREACGLNNLAHLLQVYRVPNEVVARMAPLALPGIHAAQTIGA